MTSTPEQQPGQPGAGALLRAARWALRLTLSTAPRLSVVLVSSSLVVGIVTPAIALTLGSFIGGLRQLPEADSGELSRPLVMIGLTLALVLLQTVAGALRQNSRQRLGDEVELNLSLEILQHASRLDLAFYEDPASQDLVALASRNPGRHFLAFVTALFAGITSLVETGALLGILLWIEPLLTPILVLAALPFLVYRWRLAKHRFQVERLKTRKRRWSNYYFSRFTAQGTTSSTKVLDLAELLRQKFEAMWRDIMEAMRRLYQKQAVARVVGAATYMLGLVVAVGWVGMEAIHETLTLGQAATYGLAAFRLRTSLDTLWGAVAGGLESSLFITNLIDFLDAQPTVSETGKPLPFGASAEVVLENVSFCYPGRTRPAIDSVSACFRAGEIVVLVGRNGSGKTTLVKLVARLYEPTAGRILVNGTDLSEVSLRDYHDQIAMVFQHGVQFEASARENIAYGRWRHLLDDPVGVRSVMSVAGLADLIGALPEGEETHLGRMFGSVGLSAGQWKRFEFARALARKPAILILDEPAAALDAQSEREMFDTIRALRPEPTLIIVSHRLSLARLADRVLVLDEGRLVEEGAHRELMAAEGVYAKMYRLQQDRLI